MRVTKAGNCEKSIYINKFRAVVNAVACVGTAIGEPAIGHCNVVASQDLTAVDIDPGRVAENKIGRGAPGGNRNQARCDALPGRNWIGSLH